MGPWAKGPGTSSTTVPKPERVSRSLEGRLKPEFLMLEVWNGAPESAWLASPGVLILLLQGPHVENLCSGGFPHPLPP